MRQTNLCANPTGLRIPRLFPLTLMAALIAEAACATPRVDGDESNNTHKCAHDTVPGLTYLKLGRCDIAEPRCRSKLDSNTKSAGGLECMGMLALNCWHDPDKAAKYFKEAISAHACHADIHNELGMALMLGSRKDDLPEACAEFATALSVDLGHVGARENFKRCAAALLTYTATVATGPLGTR